MGHTGDRPHNATVDYRAVDLTQWFVIKHVLIKIVSVCTYQRGGEALEYRRHACSRQKVILGGAGTE